MLNKNDFDAWIVVDKNIPYQQNISTLPCLIVVIDVDRNTLKHLVPLISKILSAINSQLSKQIVVIG